jgi:hypothetical protein
MNKEDYERGRFLVPNRKSFLKEEKSAGCLSASWGWFPEHGLG